MQRVDIYSYFATGSLFIVSMKRSRNSDAQVYGGHLKFYIKRVYIYLGRDTKPP